MTRSISLFCKLQYRLSICSAILIMVSINATWITDVEAQQRIDDRLITISNDQADAIVKELKEIRKLLESIDKKGVAQAPKRPSPPTTAKVSIKDSKSMGSAEAPVTVVEFTDYQCPYCLRFVQQTFPKLKKEFIDTGKVRWVVRDLPLGFHKNARKAAQAAHCAGDQGKYWQLHHVLFANAKRLEEINLPKYAQQIRLDTTTFNNCLASGKHLTQIDQSSRDAGSVKITGTPTFVVGKSANDFIEGNRIVGARDYKAFETEITKLLPVEMRAVAR
ncbi:MAG: DsbA family protein [Candidatus Thiodiazotropha sp. (ex Notomyrtea botanica)]|nr:DsbA family protein [Candidatus Thiodiazotropha sp. (ex Notomyrtea botanica)]